MGQRRKTPRRRAVSGLGADRSRDARRVRGRRIGRERADGAPDRIVAAHQRREAERRRHAATRRRSSSRRRSSRRRRCRAAKSCSSPTFRRSAGPAATRSAFRRAPSITPVDLGGATAADIAVSQVTTDRDSTGERDHVTVAARLDEHRLGAEDRVGDAERRRTRRADEERDGAGARRAAGRVHADRRAERRDEGLGAHHAGFAHAGRRAELHDRAGRGGAGARRRAGDPRDRIRDCFSAARSRSATGRRSASTQKTVERADAARFRRTRGGRARRSRSAGRRSRHATSRRSSRPAAAS